LQPHAAICICGPDVRWCGNEAGHCRKSEWSVVPAGLRDAEKTQDKSQKADDGEFFRKINSTEEDLGSRDVIKHEKELIWYPAEVDTSIRPGWFYHTAEDDKVRPLDELLNVYYQSVGGNASLLLNIPPDKRGLFHENDVERLKQIGQVLGKTFQYNLAAGAKATASEETEGHWAGCVTDENRNTCWQPKENTEQAWITIDLGSEQEFDRIVLMEYINIGQRIEEFMLESEVNGQWIPFYKGTVVGHKCICLFSKLKTRRIRVNITSSRWFPTLSFAGIYNSGF
jgi:alpha-L-fucosidase